MKQKLGDSLDNRTYVWYSCGYGNGNSRHDTTDCDEAR